MSLRPDPFTAIPITEATALPTKRGMYNLIPNHYWGSDGENIFVFHGITPQSSHCEAGAQLMATMDGHPATEVIQLERVWLTVNPRDYC